MNDNAIQTKHSLDFEVAELRQSRLIDELVRAGLVEDDDDYPQYPFKLFRVGTCEGQWRVTPKAVEILSVINRYPGNGHFDDVLEWFEYASREARLPLRILRFTNPRFMEHLVTKRGFKKINDVDVEKEVVFALPTPHTEDKEKV